MCENGKTVELSVDHKPENPFERDRIIKAGAEIIDGRVNGILSLTRAIGDLDYKPHNPPRNSDFQWLLNNQMITSVPDVTSVPLHQGIEFIVIACDGVWDCRTSQQVNLHFQNKLRDYNKIGSLHQANHSLLEEICPPTLQKMKAMDGIGSDNMSIILVNFKKHKSIKKLNKFAKTHENQHHLMMEWDDEVETNLPRGRGKAKSAQNSG